jgi:hypothetical protein
MEAFFIDVASHARRTHVIILLAVLHAAFQPKAVKV